MREFAQIHRKQYPERTQRAVEETLSYLNQMQALCRGRGAPLILVVIPRGYQVYPEEREEMLRGLGLSDDDLDLDRPQRLLLRWASQHGVPAVDLLPAFREHRRKHPNQNLYYYPDAHLNAAGHRLAAETICANEAAMQALRSALAE